MSIRVDQTAEMEPGEIQLTRPSTELDASGVEISIIRLDAGSPRFLDPRYSENQAWGAGERWFEPDRVDISQNVMRLTLGPAVTWNLRPHMPFIVKLRDPSGRAIEDRMIWPAIRLPSSAPPPSRSDRIEAPAGQQESEEDPMSHFAAIAAEEALNSDTETATPTIEPVSKPGDDLQPARRSRIPIIAGALLAVLIIGALYFTFMGREPMNGGDIDPVPGPDLTLAGAQGFLRGKPDAATAALQADRFDEANLPDAVFLLRRYAATNGDQKSAEILGDLYAPGTFQSGGVVAAADASRAAEYYLDAGDEALLKAGEMLKADLIDDAEIVAKVKAALQAAVDAGSVKAKEYLE